MSYSEIAAIIRSAISAMLGSVESFGERLDRIRRQAGLTQKELAERANVHPQTLNRIIRGKIKQPRKPLAIRLAKALSVDPDELYVPLAQHEDPRERSIVSTDGRVTHIPRGIGQGLTLAASASPSFDLLHGELLSRWLQRAFNFRRIQEALWWQMVDHEPEELKVPSLETGEAVTYVRVGPTIDFRDDELHDRAPVRPSTHQGSGDSPLSPVDGHRVEEFIERDYDHPQPWKGGEVPLAGVAAAGRPIEGDEQHEQASVLNPILRDVQSGRYVVIRVRGDSMSPRLNDGDLLVLDTFDKTLGSKRIHAVYIYGEGSTLGVLHRVGESLVIVKANTSYPPRILGEEDRFAIQGVVKKRLEEEFG